MSVLVLVVDDEHDIRELFVQQFRKDLRADRFVMEFAYSGAEALAKIDEVRDLDLILVLSDVNMPNMTGLELLPRLKELLPGVPVVMITAYSGEDMVRQAVEAGAAGLLPKPIDFTQLRQEIESRLEMRH